MSDTKGVGIGGLTPAQEDFQSSRYNHYAPIEYETEVVTEDTFHYYPQHMGSYDGNVPITFHIPPETEWFTKLRSFRLMGTYNILEWKTTNTPPSWDAPTDTDVWSVVNNCPHTLFSTLETYIGDLKVADSSNNPYPFKVALENILNFSAWYQKTIMSADNYFRDTKQDGAVGITETKDGYNKRRVGLLKGGKKEFCVPLHTDLLSASRDLPPGYRLRFTMIRRTDDAFSMWTGSANTKKYKINLSNLRLAVTKVKIEDKIFNFFYNNLKRIPEIPFSRNIVRSYSKAKDSIDIGFPNFLEQSQLPETVYIVFVKETAFDGNFQQNPFNFQSLVFKEASIIVNNVHQPLRPLTNVVTEGRKREFYEYFLNNTGNQICKQLHRNCKLILVLGRDHFNSQAVNISLKDYFDHGYFILAFDRTPSKNNRFTRHKMDHGKISIVRSL